jgi:hypothetical protein
MQDYFGASMMQNQIVFHPFLPVTLGAFPESARQS